MKNYENEIVYNEKEDVYVRENTHDLQSAKEVKKLVTSLGVKEGDAVLDVGGHIGAFSRLCLKAGASVTVVEPDEFNLEVLRLNTHKFSGVSVIHGCATNLDTSRKEFVELFLGVNATHTGLHSMFPSRNRPSVKVPAHNFRGLVNDHSPTVLKVDIEGAEWTLDFEDLPQHIRRVHIEMHFMPVSVRALARQRAPLVHQSLLSQGFTAVKPPNFNVLWGTHPIYAR